MKAAQKFLLDSQWSMGHGQCPTCLGHKPRKKWDSPTVGHRKGCKLAKALESLDVKVTWERKNHSRNVGSLYRFIMDHATRTFEA